MLENLNELIRRLNSTNKTNEKKFILQKCQNDEIIKNIFEYTYNQFKVFGVTSKNILKYYKNNFVKNTYFKENNFFNILDKLYKREVTGHRALDLVCNFIDSNKEYEKLILNIIDKDLECRCGVKIINEVFKDLIPEFKIALAEDYNDFKRHVEISDFYYSQKLDGTRNLAIYKDGDVKMYSRNGLEFHTLDVIKKEIIKIAKETNLNNFVLDGEVCIIEDNGVENFQLIMKEINKKDHTIKNPMYCLFDFLTIDEFNQKCKSDLLINRVNKLTTLFQHKSNNIKVLEYNKLDVKELDSLMEVAVGKGWEGLILRNNIPYEGKRSKNLLKVKYFKDKEFEVKDLVVGNIRIIDNVTGLEKNIETMVSVIIDYNGYDVNVGSGFSLNERNYYYINPSQIVGKTITVKYFGESKNENGGLSLRFPIFKINHGLTRMT